MRHCAAGHPCLPARLLPPSRARTGQATSRSRSRRGPPTSWPSCRPTTSWSWTRAWPRPSRRTCRRAAEIAACKWLTDDELRVYSDEYRPHRLPGRPAMVSLPHDRRVQRPSCSCSPAAPSTCRRCFIAGKSDWGVYQTPGAFERMQASACTQMLGCHLRRRRRALGAAGAAGACQPAAAGFPG